MESNKRKKISLTPANVLTGACIVLLLVIAATGFYIVDGTEQAVVTRFGKYYTTQEPGLRFKIPFGIDKNYNVPVRVVQTEQFGFTTVSSGQSNRYQNGITKESTMLTGDLNIVDVEWIIQYRIIDPAAWLFNVQERVQTIRDISQSVINTLVGDRAILDVMGSARSSIEEAATELMNENFNQFGLGIKVITVRLQNIVPPVGVQDAFEDVNRASQDAERYINEGKEAYKKEIPLAQGKAEQQIQSAEGYAVKRVNEARGDVARFNAVYAEYRKSPQITKERLYLETMEHVFSAKQNPLLIDGKLTNVLPIKNLDGKKGGEQ